MDVTYDAVAKGLAAIGLEPRGGFHPTPDESPAQTIILSGNSGPDMWRHFASEMPDVPNPLDPNPLDNWSRDRLTQIARQFDATVVMPSDGPPYAPFQQWARRSEPLHASPLGILIHPEYGLWHGYRGALLFAERLTLPAPVQSASPCDTCADNPCLTACPVGAFTKAGYDTKICATHLRRPEGADCLEQGCRARRACPVGADRRYEGAQNNFHMSAFLRNQP